MTDDEFQFAAATLGVSLDADAVGRFARYHDGLAEANQQVNLTAIRDRAGVYTKHFLDSLAALPLLKDGDRRVVDVGSGAGFPGLALKIARPDLELTLVESVGKKADFLRTTAADLGLENVNVLPMRAEEVAFDAADRETYDVAVARAVKEVAVVAEFLLPLVRLDGRALLYEGRDPREEVERADVGTLGGTVERVERVEVPHVDGERHVVVLRKIVPTPPNYPRRTGVPAKRPLLRNGSRDNGTPA